MELKSSHKPTEVGVVLEDWDVEKLGNFVSLQRGHDLTWRDRRKGDVPVMGSAGQNGFHDTAIAKGPGVVLGRSGASFGEAHYCEKDFWPHNTALYVTDFRGNDPLFVFYFLKSIDFTRHNSGGAQQSLNRNFIYPIQVEVPRPLEQRVIAGALSDADELIGTLDQLIAKKRDLKQATMQQLLTGQTRLPSFHGEWEVKRLSEIAMLYQPITISARQFTESGYPVYGANGVVGFYREFNHDKWQVTVTCRGSTCGTVNRTVEKSWITGNAMVVNCDQNKDLNKNFLYYALLSQDLSVCITGTGQPQIVRGPLANVVLKIPRDVAEQTAIADVLLEMDAELAALEQRRDKTRSLKQGMMQELLTGRTRLV